MGISKTIAFDDVLAISGYVAMVCALLSLWPVL